MALDTDNLQPPPTTGQEDVAPFLEGLSAIEERMVMVLDLQALSASEDRAIAA